MDRTGAYLARYLAKNVVAAGLADRCEVQLAYAIGLADPVSVSVNTFGTGKMCIRDRGVIFPILSRNRFAVCLRGIAKGAKKIVLMLSYPSDEVGNHLIDPDVMDEKGVDPYRDVLTLEKYRELFGYTVHPFTGVDYVAYYMDLIRDCGAEAEVIFANDAKAILPYTKNVINCDIHTRKRTKRRLIAAGAEKVFSLDEILTAPVNGSGYNENYGLLGTNKATEDTVKLFPRDCQSMVEAIQKKLYDATGKHVEVMVYGDGAFKDPVGNCLLYTSAYFTGFRNGPCTGEKNRVYCF